MQPSQCPYSARILPVPRGPRTLLHVVHSKPPTLCPFTPYSATPTCLIQLLTCGHVQAGCSVQAPERVYMVKVLIKTVAAAPVPVEVPEQLSGAELYTLVASHLCLEPDKIKVSSCHTAWRRLPVSHSNAAPSISPQVKPSRTGTTADAQPTVTIRSASPTHARVSKQESSHCSLWLDSFYEM